MTVYAATAWRTNGAMIRDVAELGYLDGHVLDATFGVGGFWSEWVPSTITTNDLYAEDATLHHDYLDLPWGKNTFDSVVFDPPYKFSGTPSLDDFDERYGIGKPMRWQDRMADICNGAIECFRVCRKYLLVKCQDQVVSGAVRWQTDEITDALGWYGATKVDRFDFIKKGQPQPEGRRQVHARRNHSTLLVFAKNEVD